MAGRSYCRPIVPPYCIEDCRILQVDTCKKGYPYMTSPTFRGKGSKIDAKLLMHISKKSEPRGRDLSKNQEKMMTSNMDDQNLLERASNKLDCLL